MTSGKQLWLLAGGNGAGKSTFYRLFLEPAGMKIVNADLIASNINPEKPEKVSYEAAGVAEHIIKGLLDRGISFCYETVFSHVSKIDLIANAKAKGYEIILVYIHLASAELNEARVRQRVSEGGHDVPHDKIYGRIPRTMENISKVLQLVDEARFLDNSSREDPFRQIVVIKLGALRKKLETPLPGWMEEILIKNP